MDSGRGALVLFGGNAEAVYLTTGVIVVFLVERLGDTSLCRGMKEIEMFHYSAACFRCRKVMRRRQRRVGYESTHLISPSASCNQTFLFLYLLPQDPILSQPSQRDVQQIAMTHCHFFPLMILQIHR